MHNTKFVSPDIETCDFSDGFTKLIPLIMSNPKTIFLSILIFFGHLRFFIIKSINLLIFLSLSIISIHILLFISRIHTSSHILISFHLLHSYPSFHLMNPLYFHVLSLIYFHLHIAKILTKINVKFANIN